ncbi:hypothetical protein BLEM_1745 [Bifidobacterium lemurum]|uniref:Beta-carotene 15,15'-monooxygenase n=1 Tax=Bifidobacterium lemurum TaxID=1603886 RepID=A0A261FPD3_9BIFI|nr:hypothetical protein BLEM_1745 [Bifidobacterium lemurum]
MPSQPSPKAAASSGATALAGIAGAHGPRHPMLARVGGIARWALAVAACLWLSLCTAVGPLYWQEGSIADATWVNGLYFILTFAATLGIIVTLVRWSAHKPVFGTTADPADPNGHRIPRRLRHLIPTATRARIAARLATLRHSQFGHTMRRTAATCSRWIMRATDRRWKIALILFIGWLWVPTTLLAAFGADVRSQIREFSWAWNQWTGLEQPYIGFFSFVPMDIYPTAHYMWPENPTYLTDQHNIVLTLLYGAVATFSRSVTGSNDAGLVALAAGQMLFAVGCCTAAAHRFLNMPWLNARRAFPFTPRCAIDYARPEQGARFEARRFDRPELGMRVMLSPAAAHAPARFAILIFFLICPLPVFATISLTKSPLFAFAFVWWFGIWYELRATHRPAREGARAVVHLPRRTIVAFILSTCVMLVAAKYAWYIVAAQIVLAIIADRRRWATYVVALLLPTVIIHGGIAMAINSGAIIGGDPIESRGIQLQQIARVAKLNPDGISQEAKDNLAPVFNLDQMAEAYSQNDADPVKSSGIQSKKVSYKWRSVTEEDMEGFNKAWLEIVLDNPVIALDAFLAKCYGYFDVAASPYVSMDYYVNSAYVQENSTWIKYYNHDWRDQVAQFAKDWGAIPVLGWFTHGNLYVVCTLLIGAAEVIRRRWLTLVTHFPLLLLMGVMVTAPANNFERHMLPVAFVFGFVCLTFWRDAREERRAVGG